MAMDMKNGSKKPTEKKRFPVFDLILLLLIAASVAGFAFWATHREEAPTVQLTYTVRFSGVDNAYSGSLSAEKTLYSTGGTEMGTIRSCSVSGSKVYHFDANAAMSSDEPYHYDVEKSEEKSDVTVTVQVTAQKLDSGYFVEGNRIAAGMEIKAMVNGYCGEGLILTVTEGDDAHA